MRISDWSSDVCSSDLSSLNPLPRGEGFVTRKLAPGRLVIASHNAGKVREIRALLAPFGIDPVSAGDLGLPEPEETGTTFRDNALLKAHASTAASGLPALADDSGLEVAALGGRPGVYTADWAERPWFEGGTGREI